MREKKCSFLNIYKVIIKIKERKKYLLSNINLYNIDDNRGKKTIDYSVKLTNQE